MKWLALALFLAAPASAKEITITLSDADQNALGQVIDLALKSGGIQILPTVNGLVGKIQAAEKAPPPAPAPTPSPSPTP